MKTFCTILAFAATILLGTQVSNAQLKMPQPSSQQSVSQEFGLGRVSVTYSRPNTKGRKIFGELEPYGTVWRTGANSATVVKFTDEVTFEGKKVAAGEYALFTIPGKDSWTVILNKGTDQWGAYTYKEADDVLRVTVKPVTTREKVESFTIQFNNVMATSAQMQLAWENTAVNINLTTDVDARVMASIAEAMKGERKPYVEAATYYYNNNKDMKQALEWLNEAEKQNQTAPWIKYWKARVQLRTGDKAGAAATAQAGIDAAKAAKIEEYIRLNSAVLAEAKK